MPILRFVLSPEGVVRIHDAVLCLAKFSEVVDLEAHDKTLTLTALNLSKSAYAAFSLDSDVFFQSYYFSPPPLEIQTGDPEGSRFTCQLYNKALLSVFKGRMVDARERDTSIERCEVHIQDRPDKTECRLIVKMICRHGVTKTYKLTYESVEVSHALFDKNTAKNRWSIGAHVLKTFSEYFGAKTEQLDMYHEGGHATFTSYTEKIMNGKEILRQPLQTSVAIDSLDFEEFSVEEKVHVGINVKDFKAIVAHAETLKTSIEALYSHPTYPLQFTYHNRGMQCEFTLMTIGEYRGGSATPGPTNTHDRPARPSTGERRTRTVEQEQSLKSRDTMPPHSQLASRSFIQEPISQRVARPSPPLPRASVNHESLFLPADDDDERRWAERKYEDEDELAWDANADNGLFTNVLHNRHVKGDTSLRSSDPVDHRDRNEQRVAPTQRMSQIPSMFDE